MFRMDTKEVRWQLGIEPVRPGESKVTRGQFSRASCVT